MTAKAFLELLKDTFKDWTEDNAARLGAALAYYALFSIAPVLIIAVAIAGLVFGQAAAEGQIVEAMQDIIGSDAANVIQSIIQNIRDSGSGLAATLIGVVTMVLGASGLFNALKDALNTIWEIAPAPDRGLIGTLRDRALSIAFVMGIGLLLLAALAASTAVSAASRLVGDTLPGGAFAWQALNFAISFGIVTVLFAMIYKILPDARVAWSDVWIGAAFTSLLFTIGVALLGLYLGRGSVGSAYGAAGSLVVLLIWVYYSAQILFFGAEFTQVYANRYGSHIRPAEDAVRVIEEYAEPPPEPPAESEPSVPEEHTPESERPAAEDAAWPRLRRLAVPAAAATLGVVGGILIGILGPLVGLGPRSKKKDR